MLRALIVVIAVWMGGFVGSSPAEARVVVNVHVGSTLNHGRRITCSEGRRILHHRGFRDVRARDCRGSVFVYTGWRQGHRWWIDVRSRDGRITRLHRIR
jgi:hypothetical protein